eukprot:scaffold179186_cov23-Tisochrysis_lutea.AAC.1
MRRVALHEESAWHDYMKGFYVEHWDRRCMACTGMSTQLSTEFNAQPQVRSPALRAQIQAERILKLQQLASQEHPQQQPPKPMHWLIMTSPFTHKDTLSHFQQNDYFGLQPSQ